MPVRGPVRRQHEVRGLGIILLILSLVHTPLPQPDFHNIRHHHGPGEVCDHHDHLLRWHPGAGLAEDVATLHWHWFLPAPGPTDAPLSDDRPALHAHVADWFASWETGPLVVPDDHSRPLVRPSSRQPLAGLVAPGTSLAWALAIGPPRPLAQHVPPAPHGSLASRLQRWVC